MLKQSPIIPILLLAVFGLIICGVIVFGSHNADLEAERQRLVDERQRLAAEAQRLTEARRDLRQERARLQRLQQQLEADLQQLASQRQQLQVQRREQEAVHADLDQQERRLLEARQALQSERTGMEAEQQRLASQGQQLAATQQELAAEQQRLATAQQELATAQQGLTTAQQELASQHQQLASQQQRLSALREHIQQERMRLSLEQLALETDRQQLTALKQRLSGAQQQLQPPTAVQTNEAMTLPAESTQQAAATFPPTWQDPIGMEFVLIPAGTFRMGSDTGLEIEQPAHTVHISRPFYLGKYEVTQEQWKAVMHNNPSHFKGKAGLPVEHVSWEQAQEFIRRLNVREGEPRFRLPTEAEWEYAARAGTTTAFSFGKDTGRLADYAWYWQNAGKQTRPVGRRRPNAWGLYDIHGNVWEWVQDRYGMYTSSPVTDPQGSPTGEHRIMRGGSWFNDASYCRSAARGLNPPDSRYSYLGFRLLRTTE